MTAPVPTLDELSALSPRTDVEALRGGLVARLQAGEGSEPLLIHLAESIRSPSLSPAGPRADGRLVPLALKVAAVPDALSPPALYRRLVDLTLRGGWNEAARSVLDHVVFAHEDAPWVIALALRAEGRGWTHPPAVNPRHPRLGERCLARLPPARAPGRGRGDARPPRAHRRPRRTPASRSCRPTLGPPSSPGSRPAGARPRAPGAPRGLRLDEATANRPRAM